MLAGGGRSRLSERSVRRTLVEEGSRRSPAPIPRAIAPFAARATADVDHRLSLSHQNPRGGAPGNRIPRHYSQVFIAYQIVESFRIALLVRIVIVDCFTHLKKIVPKCYLPIKRRTKMVAASLSACETQERRCYNCNRPECLHVSVTKRAAIRSLFRQRDTDSVVTIM